MSDAKGVLEEDVKTLHKMGYAQELARNMSTFLELCDLVLDHLCAVWRDQFAGSGHKRRRRRGGRNWLACRRRLRVTLLTRHGANRLRLPDSGRALSLELDSRRTLLGLAHGLDELIGLVTVLAAINVGTYYFFIGSFAPLWALKTPTLIR